MVLNIHKQVDLENIKKNSKYKQNYFGSSPVYINLQKKDISIPKGIDIARLQKFARILRALAFSAVEAGQSGHPGGSSSKVEQMLALLFGGILANDLLDPKNPGRDRIVWSAGHCTPLLYATLSFAYESLRISGKKFSKSKIHAVMPKDLLRFRHSDGPQGHVESYYPLSDVSTGPSGHGLPAAGGLAISHRASGLDTKVWVFMGDAESEEGITYEARNILSKVGTTNLIVNFDYNHNGIDGVIEEVIDTPIINHWFGLGWNVIEIDGHNVSECINAQHLAVKGFENNLPTVIINHTLKGKSYGDVEDSAKSHGAPAKHDDFVDIVRNLGFDIAGKQNNLWSDIQKIFNSLDKTDIKYIVKNLDANAKRIKSEKKLVQKMQKKLKNKKMINPRQIRRPKKLPKELVFTEGENIATRKATQAWFEWMMKNTAFLYAGTGDLSGSILLKKAEDVHGIITKKNPLGRGIRFGIAEPNMAMMSTALTHDILPGGFRPISVFGSYGVFTSMMSNCVRLALIGNHLCPKLSGFFVMLAGHDGPETGEDGPTHQGMYWMSMFSAYPGIKVYKPMDANETIEMLFHALKIGEPIALSIMRPNTPVLKRGKGVPPASEAVNGAYVYKKFRGIGKKKVVLVISGVQVLINTVEVLPELEKKGLDVKIVAVTSPELFEDLRKTNPKKAQSILSDSERKMVITLHNGWKGFLNSFMLPADHTKKSVGIDTYLKSGNVQEVYELAELTGGDIKKKILRCIL